MVRALLPGRWNRNGHAVPDNQLSELDLVLPPNVRNIRMCPKLEPVHQRPRRKPRGAIYIVAMVALIAVGVIVLLAPVQSGQAVATLFVGPR
jgi:hypothetical protein